MTYPNGVKATHAYDRADRLTRLTNLRGPATVSAYAYGYDKNGNRLSQVETNGGVSETTTYTYDGLDRLTTVTYPVDASFPGGRVVTYGYDSVGNRIRETEKTTGGAVLADKQGVFDNTNRLTALNDLVSPANSTSFGWDANGNQNAKTVGTGPGAVTTEYRYDIRDKMVETVQGVSILGRFQYDCEGRRTKKIGEEGLRQYVYDQTSLLLEYDDAGNQVAKYDYGSDRLISLFRRDEPRRYFSLDGLRSVVNLTDDSGSVAASYHLDAWGNFRFPAELTASKNRFAFTGYVWDPETGLFNAKARYFDPQIGRFTNQDSFLGSIDDPPSLHRYFYGNDNPLRYVDPTGHESEGANPPVNENQELLQQATMPSSAMSPELARALQDYRSANSTRPTVVQEPGWLETAWQKISEGYEGVWAWAQRYIGDQGEAAGKSTIRRRPPSEATTAKQQAAEALADRDPTLSGAASREAERADLARGARTVSGELGRAGAETTASGLRTAVETEGVGKLIGGAAGILKSVGRRAGRTLAAESRVARTAEETIATEARGSRLAATKGEAVGRAGETGVAGGTSVAKSPFDVVPERYRASIARAFEGTPGVETLREDLIVYRRWGGKAVETGSPWFAQKPYVRPGAAQRYLALPSGNTAENMTAFRILAGTTILRGNAATQVGEVGFGSRAVGGGVQIYVPDPSVAIPIR